MAGEVCVVFHRFDESTCSTDSCLATLFAFFETLLHLGSQSKCTNAIANLNSMESLLQKWGYSEIIYEDFRDTTLELLERISTWTLLPDAEAALTAAFNDAQTSQEVIQYFRVSYNAE